MKRLSLFLVVCLVAVRVFVQNTFESALTEAVADIRQKLPQNATVAVPDFVIPQEVMAEQSASRSELSAFYSAVWAPPQPASFSGRTVTSSNTGVYVGIVSFGTEAEDLTRPRLSGRRRFTADKQYRSV